MTPLKHFVDFIFQCPSFMFVSFSGTRSLHHAGLHTAKFILYWMTNCIWICRVEGQGCSLLVSQAPSKCLSHENVLASPLCRCPLKSSWILNSALVWLPTNGIGRRRSRQGADTMNIVFILGQPLGNDNPEFWNRSISWALNKRCIMRAQLQPVNQVCPELSGGAQKPSSARLKREVTRNVEVAGCKMGGGCF